MRTETRNTAFSAMILQSRWFQYSGLCFLCLAAQSVYYATQESKKIPEEKSVRIVVGDDVLKEPLPAGMREMDLGISKDIPTSDILGTKPRFEIWDMERYEYNEKMRMFWKPCKPQTTAEAAWNKLRGWFE